MFEVWYWCWQRGEWRRLEGPDYDDLFTALRAARSVVQATGRSAQVRDLYTGEVLHQLPGQYAPAVYAQSW